MTGITEEEGTGARNNNEDKYQEEEREGFQMVEEEIHQKDKVHITRARNGATRGNPAGGNNSSRPFQKSR